mmetsp:Transcript_17714/g.49578  ORF Transcript_17714/g.49578 Transcript_17714/m.49578 type:complete len:222 (+) Transcript_17714:1709-2374(+)
MYIQDVTFHQRSSRERVFQGRTVLPRKSFLSSVIAWSTAVPRPPYVFRSFPSLPVMISAVSSSATSRVRLSTASLASHSSLCFSTFGARPLRAANTRCCFLCNGSIWAFVEPTACVPGLPSLPSFSLSKSGRYSIAVYSMAPVVNILFRSSIFFIASIRSLVLRFASSRSSSVMFDKLPFTVFMFFASLSFPQALLFPLLFPAVAALMMGVFVPPSGWSSA